MRFALLLVTACGRIGFDARAGDAAAADAPLPIAAAFEAESCTLVAPFAVMADATASAGAYMIDGNSRGITGAGSATCALSVPTAGTFYLWVRTITVDTATDSFFVAIDGASYSLEPSTCLYGPSWHWGALRIPYNCNMVTGAVQPLALDAGMHTLVLTSREGQSIVDRIIFVTDPAYVPSD